METVIGVLHVVVCLLLILVIMIQSGKGASLAGLFGGGQSSEALFTAPGGNVFMKKVTAGLAIAFALLSIMLTLISIRSPERSIMGSYQPPAPPPAATQPAAPAAPAAPAKP